MADGFETMIDAAGTFFAELAKNNEKAFYEANKARYVEEIKKPAEFLGGGCRVLGGRSRMKPGCCVIRGRDV